MSKIQVNDIVNHYDTGAPQFPKGIAVGGGGTLGLNVGTGASVYSPSNNVLTLGTNNTEKLRITSGGNIGIGTDTFTATSSGRQIVEIEGASGSLINFAVGGARKAYHFTDGTDVYSYNTVSGSYIFGTSDAEKVRITGFGSFGIGDDDPIYKLSVKDTKADGTGVQLHLWNNSTNNTSGNVWSGIKFTGSTANYETAEIKGWRVHPGTGLNSLSINTGGVERMVLSSSGVGIGTDNPDTTLTIKGTADGVLNLDTTDTRGTLMRFKENGTTKQWVGSAEGMGGGLSGDQDDMGLRAVGNMFFSAGGSEQMSISEAGIVNFGGQSYGKATSAGVNASSGSEYIDIVGSSFVFVKIMVKVGYSGNATYQMHVLYDYVTSNYYTTGSTATRTDILQVEAANAQFNYSDFVISRPANRTVRLTYTPTSGSGTHAPIYYVSGIFNTLTLTTA